MTTRSAWHGIKQRCGNPNRRQWKDYGGRGVSVRFVSFDEFFSEVGERPPGKTIDRIDNNGDYAPGNVRWSTREEQQRNRRNTSFIDVDGERYRVADLVRKTGLKHDTIVSRAKRGLSLNGILSTERFYNLSGLALGGDAFGAKKRQQTHCSHGHEFAPENTYTTPEGWRNCRTCHNAKMRRRAAAKKMREK